MFVELIGLSGSGKSTVELLLHNRTDNGIERVAPCQRRLHQWLMKEPLQSVRSLALLAPHCAYALLRSDGPTGLAARYAPTSSLLNLLSAYEQCRADISGARIKLFDEFVLQRALSLFAFAEVMPPWLPVSSYLRRVHRRYPALPVFIEVDAGQALAQARLRPGGLAERYASLEPAAVDRIYAVQVNFMKALAESLPAAVRVDGSQPPGVVAQTIENEVLRRQTETVDG